MKGLSYKVVLKKIKEDSEEGRANFAKEVSKIFGISEDLSMKIVSSAPVVVKKECTKEVAEKIFYRLTDLGADCNVEELICESYQGLYVPEDYGRKSKGEGEEEGAGLNQSSREKIVPLNGADTFEPSPVEPGWNDAGGEIPKLKREPAVPEPPDEDPKNKDIIIPLPPDMNEIGEPASNHKENTMPPSPPAIVTCLECGESQPSANKECRKCHFPL